MERWQSLLAGTIVTAGGVLAALWQSPALAPASGHRLLHLGCPPGSHGKPRHAGIGEALQRARSGETDGSADELSARRLTAGHPGAARGGGETER